MITDIPIKEMAEEQLESAYDLAFRDMQFSAKDSLQHLNAKRCCEALYQEAVLRGYIDKDGNPINT